MKTLSLYVIIKYICVLNLVIFKIQAQESRIMLFYDISGSLKKDPAKLEKQKLYLAQEIEQRIDIKANLSLAYLFDNSASVLNKQELQFVVDESQKPIRQQRMKFSFAKRAVDQLFSDSSAVNKTLILSSLRHVSEEAQKREKITAFYITDFLEDSDIRIIGSKSLKSIGDAKKKGTTDAQEVMDRYGLTKNTTCEVQIIGMLPLTHTDNREIYVFLNSYWEAVFHSLFEKCTIKYHVL